jgi:hypothetical protein
MWEPFSNAPVVGGGGSEDGAEEVSAMVEMFVRNTGDSRYVYEDDESRYEVA